MPFVNGVFTRVDNSFSEPVEGTLIEPVDANSLFNDYDTGLTQALGNIFNVASFANPQAAINAAVAANGGVVYFPPGDYTIASPLTIPTGTFYPIRLTGTGNLYSGPASSNTQIFYTGAVAAVQARDSRHVEIDHLNFFCSNASIARVIDFSASIPGTTFSFAPYVHDCTIETTVPTAACYGIDLHDAQHAVIERNEIAINGGTGILGIPAGGLWSVAAKIKKNMFGSGNAVGIEGPGQGWTVAENTVQSVPEFIIPGPAGRCDVLTVEGNWIGDFFSGGVTIIHSNAGALVSKGNVYANFATGGTCILQDNSTGAVISIGDRMDGAVGIAIGTGNYLSITAPDQGHLPTALFTGTPANTNVVETIGGAANITGKLSLGLSGSIAGSLRFWNATGGANSVTVEPLTGAIGLISLNWPSSSGRLVTRDSSDLLQNKTLDNSNIITLRDDRFTLQDSGDTTKQAVFELSGITTATTRTYTLPDANGTLLYSGGPLGTPASGVLTNCTGLPIATGVSGLGANVAIFLGTPSSANLRAALTDETGTGALVFQGGNIGAATGTSLAVTGALTSSSPTAGIGYSTGAGGAVTQITSRTTPVTINTVSGAITMFTAAGSASAAVFTVNNSAVVQTDTISLSVRGASNFYNAFVTNVTNGSFAITFYSASGTASDTPIINFNVTKGVLN